MFAQIVFTRKSFIADLQQSLVRIIPRLDFEYPEILSEKNWTYLTIIHIKYGSMTTRLHYMSIQVITPRKISVARRTPNRTKIKILFLIIIKLLKIKGIKIMLHKQDIARVYM